MMDILENKEKWRANYHQGWLAQVQKDGQVNWRLYKHPSNEQAPGTSGVRLNQSRLMLISSAGGYLRHGQKPFNAASVFGDYTMRTFPSSTSFDDLAYAHDHYDRAMIQQDPQVALPLRHLEEMVDDGQVGELAPSVVSFMGYQPDAARTVEELIPQVVAAAQAERVDAALLVPV